MRKNLLGVFKMELNKDLLEYKNEAKKIDFVSNSNIAKKQIDAATTIEEIDIAIKNAKERSFQLYKKHKAKIAKELAYDKKCFEDIKLAKTKNEVDKSLTEARHRKWNTEPDKKYSVMPIKCIMKNV